MRRVPAALTSRSVEVQVQPTATLTSVTSSPLIAVRGQTVTLIADVSSSLSAGGAPTGTVVFQDAGTTISGCGARPVSKGRATCSVTYPVASEHSITAAYSGDAATPGRCRPPSPSGWTTDRSSRSREMTQATEAP